MINNPIYCTNPNDIRSEHILIPWGNGFKLMDSRRTQSDKPNLHKVANILKKSINIYFSDTESRLKNVNEATVINCGFQSISDCLGRTVRDVAKKHSAEQFLANDHKVIKFCKPQVTDDLFDGLDDSIKTYLTMKFPWYCNDNQPIGIFGCSIPLDKHSLADSLTQLAELGIINQALPRIKIDDVYFSQREKDCLHHYVRGKSAREISIILLLSKRTIEHYLDNIKIKLNVSTKSELIDKVFNYFI